LPLLRLRGHADAAEPTPSGKHPDFGDRQATTTASPALTAGNPRATTASVRLRLAVLLEARPQGEHTNVRAFFKVKS